MKLKVCLSNLVYGEKYTQVFLNNHLKTLVDDSNLYAFGQGSEYLIFTDGTNIEQIKENVFFKKLNAHIPVKFLIFSAPQDGYKQRYSIQGFQLKNSAEYALQRDMFLSMQAADIIFAQGFWTKVLTRLAAGHDGVVGHPMRAGHEGVADALHNVAFAPESDHLFELCLANQHPLWLAQNWASPFFSKMPYHLLWGDSQSLVVRPFSMSPSVFKPNPAMVQTGGNADIYVVPLLKNPCFIQDWSDMPWAEVGFVSSWFPPFGLYPASTLRVAHWAKQVILPQNVSNLRHVTYFKKQSTPIPYNLIHTSSHIAEEIISLIGLMSSPK